jgi:hypothetical protein
LNWLFTVALSGSKQQTFIISVKFFELGIWEWLTWVILDLSCPLMGLVFVRCWSEASIPHYVGLFIGLVRCLHDIATGFPRVNNSREEKIEIALTL